MFSTVGLLYQFNFLPHKRLINAHIYASQVEVIGHPASDNSACENLETAMLYIIIVGKREMT